MIEFGTGTMAQFAIRSMPDTKFVLPLAPTRKITVYHGTSMHAWYDIFGLDDKCAQDRERIAESTVRTMGVELVFIAPPR